MNKQIWTAHSGADGLEDNSMLFVNYAVKTKADALEIDVRRSSETGELVLGHDNAKEDAPLLRDVFKAVLKNPTICINCDLKESNLEKDTIHLAREMGLKERLILSGTVSPENIRDEGDILDRVYWNIDEQFSDFYVKCATEEGYVQRAMQKMCDMCKFHGISIININNEIIDESVIEIAKNEGMRLSVWTVNSPERMRWLRSQGVYNITTRSISQALSLGDEGLKDS